MAIYICVYANRSSELVIMTSHYAVILHINSVSRVQTNELVIRDKSVSETHAYWGGHSNSLNVSEKARDIKSWMLQWTREYLTHLMWMLKVGVDVCWYSHADWGDRWGFRCRKVWRIFSSILCSATCRFFSATCPDKQKTKLINKH